MTEKLFNLTKKELVKIINDADEVCVLMRMGPPPGDNQKYWRRYETIRERYLVRNPMSVHVTSNTYGAKP